MMLAAAGARIVYLNGQAPYMQSGLPVKSQLDTVPDGNISIVGNTLIVNEDLRRRFDYYLAGIDERPLAQLVTEIELDLESNLPVLAAIQAKHILHQYINFKRALSALKQDPLYQGRDVETIRRRQLAIHTLRAQFFDTDNDKALFGWEDTYNDDALARYTIAQDKMLTVQEKQRKLAELDAQAAPDIITLRQKPISYLALAKTVKQARMRGASDEVVFKIRAANAGEDVAIRLAVLDQKENAWHSRIVDFKREKLKILSDRRLNELERETAVKNLREAHFNEKEQKRLPTYESRFPRP